MAPVLLPRGFPGGRLRRLRAEDLAAFQAYRSIPGLGRYQGWSPMSGDEALGFLEAMHAAPLLAPGAWVQLGIADARNLPSLRLLRRLGFGRVGSRPTVFRGEPCVEEVFSLPGPRGDEKAGATRVAPPRP